MIFESCGSNIRAALKPIDFPETEIYPAAENE